MECLLNGVDFLPLYNGSFANSSPFGYCVWDLAVVQQSSCLPLCWPNGMRPNWVTEMFFLCVCVSKFWDNWCQSFGTLCVVLITVILLGIFLVCISHYYVYCTLQTCTPQLIYSFPFQSSQGKKAQLCATLVRNGGSQLPSHFHSVHMWQLGSLSYVRLNLCRRDNLSYILPCICT